MRHRVKTNQFNRDTKHRKALLRNMVVNLVERGAIVTTKPKAKEIKRQADKMLGKAVDTSLATRRVLHRFFGRRDVVNTIVDKIMPQMEGRVSGFTRITPVAKRRGDNTEMVKLSLVAKYEPGLGAPKQDTVVSAPKKATTQKQVTPKAPKKSATTPKKETTTKTTKKATPAKSKKTASKKTTQK